MAMGYHGVKYSLIFKVEELILGVSVPEKHSNDLNVFVNTQTLEGLSIIDN